MAENESERTENMAVSPEAAGTAPKAEAAEAGKREKPKKSWKREVFEWVMVFVVAGVIAFVVRTFVFVPVMVDGQSMMNTLQDREFLIATKYDYLLGDPERFDVVICHYPGRMRPGLLGIGEVQEDFVKRVVGLPGETIELRAGELYVNGEFVAQDFARTESVADFGPYTVPEGHYFVMGDNRNNSTDGRDPRIGVVDQRCILGKALFVLLPFQDAGVVESVSQPRA